MVNSDTPVLYKSPLENQSWKGLNWYFPKDAHQKCEGGSVRSDLKILDSFTLEKSEHQLIRNFLRNGRVRVNFLYLSFSVLPVDKSALSIHQIEFVIESGPGLSDRGGVWEHTDGTLNLSQIASGHDSWGLIVQTDLNFKWNSINLCFYLYLETSRAPVDELDGSLCFNVSNGGVNVFGDNISAV